MVKRTTWDTLEDTTAYFRSDGCEVNPVEMGCLTCPMAYCRYDDGVDYQAEKWARYRSAIVARFQAIEGPNRLARIRVVADEFGITRRTVYRTLARMGA